MDAYTQFGLACGRFASRVGGWENLFVVIPLSCGRLRLSPAVVAVCIRQGSFACLKALFDFSLWHLSA